MDIEAIIFDKDGTLFQFDATWGPWAIDVLGELSEGNLERKQRLAEDIGLDLQTGTFAVDSPFIAGTLAEQAQMLADALPKWEISSLAHKLSLWSATADLVPVAGLVQVLETLRARGLPLAVVTNDAEQAARAHLQKAGVLDHFAFVAGYDSGFGSKPDAAPLLAAANMLGVDAHRCAMVGDSTHDLQAARAAQMHAIAVLTGPAQRAMLAPYARVVLRDISLLPDYLDPPSKA